MDKAFCEIKRVLKPRGRFFATFHPTWTSISGHHCFSVGNLVKNGEQIDEDILFSIPPWGHLYMSEKDMADCLSQSPLEEKRIPPIIDFMYKSREINRLSASDIKKNILGCGMIVRSFQEFIAFNRKYAIGKAKNYESELTPEIKEKLNDTSYNVNDIGILGMTVMLEKYENL